ncbi:MAG: hypothetical protein HHJ17_00010 [Rhodoferax sp.]|uniref:hypothetical protein n=1 Tax=Rhodoferax sp. TaxID=50421 RepID=UPI0017F6050C|nr:hypothetical protein [Rhodoferax sp.]NMM11913.1 hypothetical protein [Rhodoferax sp.]
MRWVKSKWLWAKQNPLFWVNAILFGVAVAAVYIWPAPAESDFRVRTLGMLLQLIGVGTVWFDLTSTARSFGKTGLMFRTWTWIKAGFAGRTVNIGVAAMSSASATASGRMTVRWPMNASASQLDRIDAVEKNLTKIDEDIQAVFTEIDRNAIDMKERILNESNERTSAIGVVRRDLEEAAAGNFPFLVFGAVWLGIGVVLATWSPEIVKVVAGKWSVVITTI